MIEAVGLTKRYGDRLAVDRLSFTVKPGQVTGFLGPNGAGKSTTMRMILGLDRPTDGTVTVNGRPFARLDNPMREVGALLDAKAIHGGRTAYHHLLCLAQTNGLPHDFPIYTTVHTYYRNWRRNGPWGRVHQALAEANHWLHRQD